MRIDDDEVWLAALAGRAASTEGNAALLEGRAVRALLLATEFESSPTIRPVDAKREAELIARAHTEELLQRAPATGRTLRSATFGRSRRSIVMRGALAAALAGVAIAVGLLHFSALPPETSRGTPNGNVLLRAQDPRALKRELMKELGAAGVRARGYEQLNRLGIDADLPEPVPPRVRRILEQHHIPVPNDGALVIEISASGDR